MEKARQGNQNAIDDVADLNVEVNAFAWKAFRLASVSRETGFGITKIKISEFGVVLTEMGVKKESQRLRLLRLLVSLDAEFVEWNRQNVET